MPPYDQPVVVPGLGLVITGTAGALYLTRLANPGAGPYEILPVIPAEDHIHGWAVDENSLYVMDGVRLACWDLVGGKKECVSAPLAEFSDEDREVLRSLRDAQRLAAWADLYVQACREPGIAPEAPGTVEGEATEADNPEALAADLRRLIGGAGAVSLPDADAVVAGIRHRLVEAEARAAPLRFSVPVVRRMKLDRPEYAVFVVQREGSLHCYDAALQHHRRHPVHAAEPFVAILEDGDRGWLAVPGDGILHCFDAGSLETAGRWTPDAPEGETRTLLAARGQFWWGTTSALHALEPDTSGVLRPRWHSTRPGWSGRQVGTCKPAHTPFGEFDPDALFEAMDPAAWIRQYVSTPGAIPDGGLAHALAGGVEGYDRPPAGHGYVVHGPFSAPAPAGSAFWQSSLVHTLEPLVLLADDAGSTALCAPSADDLSGRIPVWGLGDWFHQIVSDPALRKELAAPWPGIGRAVLPGPVPSVDPETQDPDLRHLLVRGVPEFMFAYYIYVREPAIHRVLNAPELDGLMRCRLWFGIANRPFASPKTLHQIFLQISGPFVALVTILLRNYRPILPPDFMGAVVRALWSAHELIDLDYDHYPVLDDVLRLLPRLYSPGELETLQGRFRPDATWDVPAGCEPLHFEVPPYLTLPHRWNVPLFRKDPPGWCDPWGVNGPTDFRPPVPGSFFDPVSFPGKIAFPQRPLNPGSPLASGYASYSAFTSGDPAVHRPDGPAAAGAEPPQVLVLTSDSHARRTAFHLLPCLPHPFLVDLATGEVTSHGVFGYCERPVVARPTVFTDPDSGQRTACCVTASGYPNEAIRRLAETDSTGESAWNRSLAAHRELVGPGGPWRLEDCPSPADWPAYCLEGYELPLPSSLGA